MEKSDITESLATVASSAIRQAIVAVLASKPRISFSELRESLNRRPGLRLTDGNLVFHLDSAYLRLEKLRLAGVIEAEQNGNGKAYALNTVGHRVNRLIKAAKP
jgi:DNA-binding transcriptional ArsR family regulator